MSFSMRATIRGLDPARDREFRAQDLSRTGVFEPGAKGFA